MSAYSPLTLEALYALDLPEVEYAVDGLIPLGALTLVSAREKAGKGLLAIDLCASVAFEEPFLDRAVMYGPAIYCAAEENVRDVRARITTRVPSRRGGPLLVLPLDGSTADRLDLADAGGVQRLHDMIRELRPVVVVLDVLRELHTGREDVSDDMAPILRPLRQIAHSCNVALVLTHHMSKGGTSRGSTAIRPACDVAIEMATDELGSGDGLTATLRVMGRYGPRQQFSIRLGEGLRWAPAVPSVTAGEATLGDRIVAFVAECGEAGATSAEITKGLQSPHPGGSVALKTVQNAVSGLLGVANPPIVSVGRGVKGDARRYRLPQPGLFLPEGDSLGGREGRNPLASDAGIIPESSGNDGNGAGEWSDGEWEGGAL
ncbi:MAG: AAA family ATPase [Thermomicrobiales bacterium]